ncbi:MAG: hypothetical protein EXR06_01905 [Rickettsiales bacterium]|nr:hypothetical protein [Rickettsiales bacterium]
MDKIKSLIKNNGSLSIADFINEAMFNPLHGYYCTKKPIGKKGDFITAPEISQTFGELIAAYFLNFILSSNKKIALVEMGAGRGTLFHDILFTISALTKKLGRELDIKERITFHIIEISESLTKIQQENLQDCGASIIWYQDFEGFKKQNSDREIYFFANELFDCFPTHQFIKTADGWQERMVGILDDELVFCAENFNATKDKMVQSLINQDLADDTNSVNQKIDDAIDKKSIAENTIFEHSFAAINLMNEIAESLKTQGGIGLIIDYGYLNPPLKSTLQALKNHQYHDVLRDVGDCDITTLVNFFALRNCVKKFQLNSSLITQREFLLSLGIEERRKILCSKNDGEQNYAIDRLIDREQMGELFKCLIIWS